MLILLVLPLESPPVPLTVKVSAEVMPVFLIEEHRRLSAWVLASVLLIVMLLPPGPPMLFPSKRQQ